VTRITSEVAIIALVVAAAALAVALMLRRGEESAVKVMGAGPFAT
jgi:hypothetical protein